MNWHEALVRWRSRPGQDTPGLRPRATACEPCDWGYSSEASGGGWHSRKCMTNDGT